MQNIISTLILLEFPDPLEHLQVFVATQMHVVPSGVPGVEGMVSDHVQGLFNGGKMNTTKVLTYLNRFSKIIMRPVCLST